MSAVYIAFLPLTFRVNFMTTTFRLHLHSPTVLCNKWLRPEDNKQGY